MKRASDVPPVVESFGSFPVTSLIALADDERGPGDAHDFLAVHVLFPQNAESDGDFLVGIA